MAHASTHIKAQIGRCIETSLSKKAGDGGAEDAAIDACVVILQRAQGEIYSVLAAYARSSKPAPKPRTPKPKGKPPAPFQGAAAVPVYGEETGREKVPEKAKAHKTFFSNEAESLPPEQDNFQPLPVAANDAEFVALCLKGQAEAYCSAAAKLLAVLPVWASLECSEAVALIRATAEELEADDDGSDDWVPVLRADGVALGNGVTF